MHMLSTDFSSCKTLKTTPVAAAAGASAAAGSTAATSAAAAAANGAAADAASSPTSRFSPSCQPDVASPSRPVYGPVPPPNHPASQQQQHQRHQRPSCSIASAGRGMRHRATSFVGTDRKRRLPICGRWDAFCIISLRVGFPSKFKGTSQYHIFQKIQVYIRMGSIWAFGNKIISKHFSCSNRKI